MKIRLFLFFLCYHLYTIHTVVHPYNSTGEYLEILFGAFIIFHSCFLLRQCPSAFYTALQPVKNFVLRINWHSSLMMSSCARGPVPPPTLIISTIRLFRSHHSVPRSVPYHHISLITPLQPVKNLKFVPLPLQTFWFSSLTIWCIMTPPLTFVIFHLLQFLLPQSDVVAILLLFSDLQPVNNFPHCLSLHFLDITLTFKHD